MPILSLKARISTASCSWDRLSYVALVGLFATHLHGDISSHFSLTNLEVFMSAGQSKLKISYICQTSHSPVTGESCLLEPACCVVSTVFVCVGLVR